MQRIVFSGEIKRYDVITRSIIIKIIPSPRALGGKEHCHNKKIGGSSQLNIQTTRHHSDSVFQSFSTCLLAEAQKISMSFKGKNCVEEEEMRDCSESTSSGGLSYVSDGPR